MHRNYLYTEVVISIYTKDNYYVFLRKGLSTFYCRQDLEKNYTIA